MVSISSRSSPKKFYQKFVSTDDSKPPIGLRWRASTLFIVSTVGVGMFTDLFLYGLIVPVLPFMLHERVHVPESQVQDIVSNLLAVYAAASMLASPVAGILADRVTSSRRMPFLLGLVFLLLATVLLSVGTSIPVLTIARVLQGASGGTVWTIGLALLVETVGQENLGKAIGSIFSCVSVAALFAPVLGGVLYAKTGYKGVFGLGISLLAIDFIMRLLVLEKREATKYASIPEGSSPDNTEESATDESTPLLPDRQSPELSDYYLPKPTSRTTSSFPILLLLRDPSLLTALFISFIQAFLLGAFDATIPLVASTRYGFDSLKAGLLFFPLGGADFFLGPVFGWAVDRFGTKPVSFLGFVYLVPVLALLRLPLEVTDGWNLGPQIALYACLLAFCGIGLSIVNSPSIVESGAVVEKYYKANTGLFKDKAPYAQLYGISSMVFSGGLTIGPLAAGGLRQRIGYGNMNAVLAGVCGFTAVLSFSFIGEGWSGGRWTRWIRRRVNTGSGEEI